MEKTTELSQVVSVVTVKGCSYLSVCMRNPDDTEMVDLIYPLCTRCKRKDWVGCGSKYVDLKDVSRIRPATYEEVMRWRNSEGVLSSGRKKANTIDKVKALKWVDCGLRFGREIITDLPATAAKSS